MFTSRCTHISCATRADPSVCTVAALRQLRWAMAALVSGGAISALRSSPHLPVLSTAPPKPSHLPLPLLPRPDHFHEWRVRRRGGDGIEPRLRGPRCGGCGSRKRIRIQLLSLSMFSRVRHSSATTRDRPERATRTYTSWYNIYPGRILRRRRACETANADGFKLDGFFRVTVRTRFHNARTDV